MRRRERLTPDGAVAMNAEQQARDVGALSRALIGKKVGFVRITTGQKHTERYEVAAWYTNYVSDLGDYDLILSQGTYYPYGLYVSARVPATVTGNNHAPLFGGVAYGAGED